MHFVRAFATACPTAPLAALLATVWAGALLAPEIAQAQTPALSAIQVQQYQNVCARCHARPDSGAPLVGDAAAWSTRNTGGFDQLLKRSVDGWQTMPPLGTCGSCSEADLRALVAYVSSVPDPEAAR